MINKNRDYNSNTSIHIETVENTTSLQSPKLMSLVDQKVGLIYQRKVEGAHGPVISNRFLDKTHFYA